MTDVFTDLTNAIAQMCDPSSDETKDLHHCVLAQRDWFEAEIARQVSEAIAEHAAQPAAQAAIVPQWATPQKAVHSSPSELRKLAADERQRLREGRWESVSDPFSPLSATEDEQKLEDTVRARQAEFEAGIQSNPGAPWTPVGKAWRE